MNFFLYDPNPVRSRGLTAIAIEQSIELFPIPSISMLKSRWNSQEPSVIFLSEDVFWKLCEQLQFNLKRLGNSRVVCLLEQFTLSAAKRLIDWGCAAVLSWTDVSDITRCMNALRVAQHYLQPHLLTYLLKNEETDENPQLFSRRECEILALIYAEYSAKEIAVRLNLSVRTVEWHRKRMMEKTGSRNMIGLVKYGLTMDLIVSQN